MDAVSSDCEACLLAKVDEDSLIFGVTDLSKRRPYNVTRVAAVTDTPSFSPADSNAITERSFQLSFNKGCNEAPDGSFALISSGAPTAHALIDKLLDSWLNNEGNLSITKGYDVKGYEIALGVVCGTPYKAPSGCYSASSLTLSTRGISQEGSFLKATEVDWAVSNSLYDLYNLTFEFKCRLIPDGNPALAEYIQKEFSGEFRTQLRIDK
ncbi:MAG: hypothetical protein AAF849_11290 [Bacteroidota bacterium]